MNEDDHWDLSSQLDISKERLQETLNVMESEENIVEGSQIGHLQESGISHENIETEENMEHSLEPIISAPTPSASRDNEARTKNKKNKRKKKRLPKPVWTPFCCDSKFALHHELIDKERLFNELDYSKAQLKSLRDYKDKHDSGVFSIFLSLLKVYILILLEYSPDSDFLDQLNKELSENVKSCDLRYQYLYSRFNAVNRDLETANKQLVEAENKSKELENENEMLKRQNLELQQMKNEMHDVKPALPGTNNNKGEKSVVPVITLDD